MSLDVANLGLRVDARQVEAGAAALDRMAPAAVRAASGADAFQTSAIRATGSAGAAGRATGGMVAPLTQASKSYNSLSYAATNASFQVQDFFVQIASGTPALRAAAQQVPQLLGALGFAGKLALIGSGLGTLVAIGATVIPMLMRTRDAAQSVDDAFGDLDASAGALQTALDNSKRSLTDLRGEFGANAAAARELYQVQVDLARLDFANSMTGMVAAVQSATAGLQGYVDRVKEAEAQATALLSAGQGAAIGLNLINEAVGALGEKYGLTRGQADGLLSAIRALGEAKTLDEQARAAAAVATELRNATDQGANLPGFLMEAAQAAGMTAEQGFRMSQALQQASVEGTNTTNSLSGAASNASLAADAAYRLANGLAVSNAQAAALAANLGAAARGAEMQATVQLASINAQIAAVKSGQDAVLAGSRASLGVQKQQYSQSLLAAGLSSTEARLATQGAFKAQTELVETQAKLRGVQADASKASAAVAKLRGGGGGGSKASGGRGRASAGGSEQRDLLAEVQAEIDRRQALIGLHGEERDLAEAVASIKGRLRGQEGRYTEEAIRNAARRSVAVAAEDEAWQGVTRRVETATNSLSDAFGDFVAGGLRDFQGFAKSILRTFQSMIADMIASAVRAPIGRALGAAMGGLGAPAGQAAPGVASGALGRLAGGFGSGFGSVVTGFKAGGFGGAFGAIGTALKGATTGLAGLGTAIGAIAGPAALVIGLFSALRGKTKELDRGLRVTIAGTDALVEQYRDVEKSRLFGLLKSRRSSTQSADPSISDPLRAAIASIQSGIFTSSKALGVGAEAFEGFTRRISLSTKDMTDEQALAAIQGELEGLGDQFAGMVPGLRRWRLEGEGAAATLTRIVASLDTVNPVLRTLGHRLYAVSVQGAGAAADLAQRFGGLDAFQSATGAYYQAFHTDGERLAATTATVRDALRGLGLVMPQTRDGFRRLVDAQNLTTVAGRTAYAALMQMAPAMDQVFTAAGQSAAAAAEAIAAAAEKRNAAIRSVADMLRDPLTLDADRYDTRYAASIAAAQERRAEIARTAGDAQLTELRLIRAAMTRLAQEQRETNLYRAAR